MLRKIKEEIDFSFVNRLLIDSYCKEFGRPAKEPEMMFKLMFLKRLYDLATREVFLRGATDMAFKYFLDLNPEDKLPHHSLLTKFKNSRINIEEILSEMLTEIVRQSIEKGLIEGNAIIVDATHSKSKGTNETPTQILRRTSKLLRKEIHGLDKSDYLGLFGMKIQSYFSAITSNVKRIIKLKELQISKISISFINSIFRNKILYQLSIINLNVQNKIVFQQSL